MTSLTRFTTDAITPCERLACWDKALWAQIAPFRTAAEMPFTGEVTFGSAGTIHLLRIAASAHRLERDDRPGAPQARGFALLIVQCAGTATLRHGGREVILQPGFWTICDADRRFTLANGPSSEQLMMLVPRDRLGMCSGLGVHAARNFGDAGGTARLLPRYLESLFDELASVADSNCAELADMAAQLVRLALFEADQGTPAISMSEMLRLRVKDYIRRNLRDPALSIDRVAAAFGCTKRHLHKVFTSDETTLSQFIWTQRLECCREALHNPHLARHSLTQIAFMWGFNDPAHFSKVFKERFGVPPGLFREQGRHGATPAAIRPRPAEAKGDAFRNAA